MTNDVLVDANETPVNKSHEIMKWLDDVQRDRLVRLQDLFESAGWPIFLEWAQFKSNEALVRGSVAPTWEENRKFFGIRQAWEDVLAFENATINEFQAVANAAREDALSGQVDLDDTE